MQTAFFQFKGVNGYCGFVSGQVYLLRYTEQVDGCIYIELDHIHPKEEPLRIAAAKFKAWFEWTVEA